MTGPMKPSEIGEAKKQYIPPIVFDAFNELITKHWNGSYSSFTQDEVVNLIEAKTQNSEDTIFKQKWLDVEEAYRNEGWKVTYDKPGYNESYKATFEFKIRK